MCDGDGMESVLRSGRARMLYCVRGYDPTNGEMIDHFLQAAIYQAAYQTGHGVGSSSRPT